MPRPSELTDDIALAIADSLEDGCSIADAAALAGIAESTYHNWIKRGEAGEPRFAEFLELTRAARARGRQKHVKAIAAAAVDDWRAAAFFLERSDPANWGRKDKLNAEHTGDVTIRVEYADADLDPSPAPPGAAGDPDGSEAV